MKIVDFLSQQVQIAVDSLKSAYPNNMVGMAAGYKIYRFDRSQSDSLAQRVQRPVSLF